MSPDHLNDLESALFARRIIMVNGPLDDQRATRVAAGLMTLDATGDDHIELRLDSPMCSLSSAFSLIDTMDVLGVPVHTVATGLVGGPVVGILAAGSHRRITASARLHLCEPRADVSGRASELALFADAQAADVGRFVTLLAENTGRAAEHLEADLQTGRYLDATQALSYGLVDEIVTAKRTAQA